MSARNAVYTIPAGISFSRALAKKLLEETKAQPEILSKILILLPTRRACRVLREALLDVSGGKPLLLPKLQPIGDIDEEELSLSITGQEALESLLDLPPAISPLKRRLLLARTIMALPEFKPGPDHALALADSLGLLMDQIYTENLSLDQLHDLVPAEFATHWQITLDFLKILSEAWPAILEEQSVMDAADRRNRLILALSQYWQAHPPQYPVIAAGTTGSIPATAKLLSVISTLPNGRVILPGLDQDIDAESWDALDETHPQYGFKHLFKSMDIKREDVQLLEELEDFETSTARRILSTELMRPAKTTGAWMNLPAQSDTVSTLKRGLEQCSVFECAHEREEAMTIAVAMRETLETPGLTAALITPDRMLARRVRAICARWNVTLDDSAGQTLDQTPLGVYLKLCLAPALTNAAPGALLALLKNTYCKVSEPGALHTLEEKALRGLKPAPGFSGITQRLSEHEDTQDAIDLITRTEDLYAPLMTLRSGSHTLQDMLNAHIELAEALSGEKELWSAETGEAAAKLLAELNEESWLMKDISLHAYSDILGQLMKSVTVRPAYGTHPRLMILGQLEARLLNADLVILGGLNEGTWPPDPGHDPWMSRPMRKNYGLPSPERHLGLAAHDFVQAFCAPRVILTRSKRIDGAPSVPARWLQRLQTVLDAAEIDAATLTDSPYHDWARTLDRHEKDAPYTRPEPRPPLAKRPRKISATRIETWLKDPYSIYARYVLKLKKLDPIAKDPDAAERGTLLHDILERFITAHKDELPQDIPSILKNLAEKEIERHHDDPATWSFWWPRFERLSQWFSAHEASWRETAKPLKIEAQGACTFESAAGSFTITAKADRIDQTDSGAAIIDYKSGGTYSQKGIKSGALPQLPVEALIISKDGFEGIPSDVASLSYWTLTGGSTPGKITQVSGDIEDILITTQNGIEALANIFDDPNTPYYALPSPENAPRFNDYEHLARIKEWTALDDSEGSEAA